MPDNPGAWLMATAKHRAIDVLRRASASIASTRSSATSSRARPRARRAGSRRGARRRRRRRPAAPRVHRVSSGAVDGGARRADAAAARRADDRGDRARVPRPRADDRAAHRAREEDARRRAACRSRCRAGPSSQSGSSSVLEVIYLVFNEGYSATAGDDWMRPALCEDALRLGRILAGLVPNEPEVHGLVALMEIQASRSRGARRSDGRSDPAARSGSRALGSRC